MTEQFNLSRDNYVELLSKMISCTEKLQNNPPLQIPQEYLIADIVCEELKDLKNINIERVEYVKKRPNLIIKYENFGNTKLEENKSLGFVGSHMDVVPANRDEWEVEPFKLTVDEKDPDILWGRGTTDCLGHVALLTLLIKELSKRDIKLNYTLGVVFIADEENGDNPEIGVTHLAKEGKLDFLKNGPVYWVDSSDVYPTVGSCTGICWELEVSGKGGHSGLPYNSINPIICAFDAIKAMLITFKDKYPRHPNDNDYKFPTSSNLKPTQVKGTNGSINQISNKVIIQGDIRLTPFYNTTEVKNTIEKLIQELNNDPEKLPLYHESFPVRLNDKNKTKVNFKLNWLGEPYEGIACNMRSIGFKLLSEATLKYNKKMDYQAVPGSLPLVKELQEIGFDLQIIGYGYSEAYHSNNEFCSFSRMSLGFKILSDVVMNF